MPTPAAPGTVIPIGVAGIDVFGTSAKPAASAAALKSMLYSLAPPVTAVYGKSAVVLPTQTVGLVPSVMVGLAKIVTVIALPGLAHPVVLFLTVMVALYTPAAAAAGTAMVIGVAPNARFTTSRKPAALAAASKSILY